MEKKHPPGARQRGCGLDSDFKSQHQPVSLRAISRFDRGAGAAADFWQDHFHVLRNGEAITTL